MRTSELTPAAAKRSRAGWLRRAAVLLAALVATIGGVTLGAPGAALAATGTTYCFPIYANGNIVGYHCFEVPFAYDPNPCLCPDFAIDIVTSRVLPPDEQYGYLGQLTKGLDLVGAANHASSPADARRLRQQAQDAFVAAGGYLRGVSLRLGQVGIADVAHLRFDPSPQPWLQAAGTDVVQGLQLVQQAQTSTNPDGLLSRAMTEFETAAGELAAPQFQG